MLSLRFLSVRDLPQPSVQDAEVTWSIQVQGGGSRCIHLDRGPEREEESNQGGVPAGALAERAGDANISPLWPEEVEVDSEGKDTVEIALHFEASTVTGECERIGDWVTTIEVEEFRLKPDQTLTLWKTLRPVAASPHTDTHDFGAIQISVTYAVDYVEEGYWFAFFCGLLPVNLILLWTDSAKSALTIPNATPGKHHNTVGTTENDQPERNCHSPTALNSHQLL